jgi:hypothetical protein
MDQLSYLNGLVGKRGFLPIKCGSNHFEVAFTVLSVTPAASLPDEYGLLSAATRSEFTVRFVHGTLLDGSNTRVISGHDISCIE